MPTDPLPPFPDFPLPHQQFTSPRPPTDEEIAKRIKEAHQAILERKEAAKQERAELISEAMAHPAIAAHAENMARMVAAAERQAAAFEKIADALSRIAPTPERLQEEAEEAPLRRAEQEGRASFWKGIAHIIPVMAQQGAEMLARAQREAMDTPGGDNDGSAQ